MRNQDLFPWSLHSVMVIGFEESKESEEESEEEDEDDDDGEKDEGKKDSQGGLKSALQKERKLRRQYERELKAAKKSQEEKDDKDKDEVTRARETAVKATEATSRLAARLMDTALDNSIFRAASLMGFTDPDDAVSLVNRKDISVDQDPDDPAEIEIDEDSIKSALESLKKRKPHLLAAAREGEGEKKPAKSGSPAGQKKKSQDELDEEVLIARYPALSRGSRK